MEITKECKILKESFKLSKMQLDFLDEMCYIHKGMWSGDINELIANEAKRDIALTLRSFNESTIEELETMFNMNGDATWLKTTVQKVITKQ
jgi:hypothetical protein